MAGAIQALDRAVLSFARHVRALGDDAAQPSTRRPSRPCSARRPALRKGTFKSLNAEAVSASNGVSTDKLVRRLERAQKRLGDAAAQEASAGLAFSFREGSKVWTFEKALELIAGHIAGHEAKLRRAATRRQRPPHSMLTGSASTVQPRGRAISRTSAAVFG